MPYIIKRIEFGSFEEKEVFEIIADKASFLAIDPVAEC
jgi:hypothetical protein